MFGFPYVTFVGMLMLILLLREADSFAARTNGKINADGYHDGALTNPPAKGASHTHVEERFGGNEETADRSQRTTLTATIDGKLTVHLIVSVEPAEQSVRVTESGQLRPATAGKGPISRSSKLRSSRITQATATRHPTPSTVSMDRIEMATEATTVSAGPSVPGQVPNRRRTGVARYQSTRIRTTTAPNKSRERQLNEGGKSPSSNLTRYPTTRIHREKVPQFGAPIFRNAVEPSKNFNATTAEDYFLAPIIIAPNRRMMSNATRQLEEFNVEPISLLRDVSATAQSAPGLPVSEIPFDGPAEETVVNPTETGVALQAEATDSPVSIDCEESDCLPWERIGDFEFQINPKSKQVVNIRLRTATTTGASYNASVTTSYEDDILGVDELLGITATNLEVPATAVVPTQMATPTVQLPVPLNRREPIIAGTQSDIVEAPDGPISARPIEQSSITDVTQTATIQRPEVFNLLSDKATTEQVVHETVTAISVRQSTDPGNSRTTEIDTSAEMEASQDIQRETSPVVESHVVETINLESVLGPIMPELSDQSDEFPWEQRHDYQVQVDPITKQIVNIRMLLTATTTRKPLSVPAPDEVMSNDHFDRTASDELTEEVLTRILERNDGKFRMLDDVFFPAAGVRVLGTRRLAADETNGNAAPPGRTVPGHRQRTDAQQPHARKPIFSHHSTEDGVFYFRYAGDADDESDRYRTNNKALDRNPETIRTDDERRTDNRRDDVLPVLWESPYFYYVQDVNSSALVKASGYYVGLLVACVALLRNI